MAEGAVEMLAKVVAEAAEEIVLTDYGQDRYKTRRAEPCHISLKGNSSDLEGYIFDCSDSRQADKYITAIKRITDYVGTEFKYGGEICLSIENSKRFEIPMPNAPSDNDTALLKMIFNRKIDI